MKNETITITCDSCGQDISPIDTRMPHAYILKLSAYDRAYNTSSLMHAMICRPDIDDDLYFCNLKCVKDWSNRILK